MSEGLEAREVVAAESVSRTPGKEHTQNPSGSLEESSWPMRRSGASVTPFESVKTSDIQMPGGTARSRHVWALRRIVSETSSNHTTLIGRTLSAGQELSGDDAETSELEAIVAAETAKDGDTNIGGLSPSRQEQS